MYKNSAARRAATARWKKLHPKTPAQKKADTAYHTTYARKNAHKRNEQRRARRARHGEREKLHGTDRTERFAGLSIVSAASLAKDRTRFVHRGHPPNRQLELMADAILAEASRAIRETEARLAREAEAPDRAANAKADVEVKLEVNVEVNLEAIAKRPSGTEWIALTEEEIAAYE